MNNEMQLSFKRLKSIRQCNRLHQASNWSSNGSWAHNECSGLKISKLTLVVGYFRLSRLFPVKREWLQIEKRVTQLRQHQAMANSKKLQFRLFEHNYHNKAGR